MWLLCLFVVLFVACSRFDWPGVRVFLCGVSRACVEQRVLSNVCVLCVLCVHCLSRARTAVAAAVLLCGGWWWCGGGVGGVCDKL